MGDRGGLSASTAASRGGAVLRCASTMQCAAPPPRRAQESRGATAGRQLPSDWSADQIVSLDGSGAGQIERACGQVPCPHDVPTPWIAHPRQTQMASRAAGRCVGRATRPSPLEGAPVSSGPGAVEEERTGRDGRPRRICDAGTQRPPGTTPRFPQGERGNSTSGGFAAAIGNFGNCALWFLHTFNSSPIDSF